MAIDTAAKRFAMLDCASGPAVHVRLFEVDGAVDADDRAFLLNIYGGNALGAVASLSPVSYLTLIDTATMTVQDDAVMTLTDTAVMEVVDG